MFIPGPGARNSRWREQYLPSRDVNVQKNLSLALKAIPKGESKKVLRNVNHYNMAVINEYSSKANTLKWYHFLMVKICHTYRITCHLILYFVLVWFYRFLYLNNFNSMSKKPIMIAVSTYCITQKHFKTKTWENCKNKQTSTLSSWNFSHEQ